MPLYIGDFLADTADLTTEETGAYLLLIFHYWNTGPLTTNPTKLARICRLSKHKFNKNSQNFLRFFFQKDEKFYHKRLEQEIAKAVELSEKRAEYGQKGGLAKAKQLLSKSYHNHNHSNTSVPTEQRKAQKEPAEKVVNFWDIGVSMGISRAMIGKWVKDHGKHKTAQAIAAASIESAVDPIPYIQKVIANERTNGSGKETVRESKHAASERRTREEIARIEAYELEHFGRVS